MSASRLRLSALSYFAAIAAGMSWIATLGEISFGDVTRHALYELAVTSNFFTPQRLVPAAFYLGFSVRLFVLALALALGVISKAPVVTRFCIT